jgi:hypothetical protein
MTLVILGGRNYPSKTKWSPNVYFSLRLGRFIHVCGRFKQAISTLRKKKLFFIKYLSGMPHLGCMLRL